MSNTNCSGCAAPLSPNAGTCEYCGRAQKTPVSVEEELALVRELARAAQKLAMDERHKDGVERYLSRATWWRNTFVPSTVPGAVALVSLLADTSPSEREITSTVQKTEAHMKVTDEDINAREGRDVAGTTHKLRDLTTIPLLEAMVDRAGQIVARIRTETDTGSQPYETATRALKTLEGRLSMAEAKYQAAINDWGFHRRLKKANFEAGLIFLACPVFGVVAWVVGAKLRDDVLFHAVGIVLVLAGVAGAPLRLWLTKRTAPTP